MVVCSHQGVVTQRSCSNREHGQTSYSFNENLIRCSRSVKEEKTNRIFVHGSNIVNNMHEDYIFPRIGLG